jgi:DNA-3-methyladenine glycosylase II
MTRSQPYAITARASPLNESRLAAACKELAGRDHRLASVLNDYGVPPLWDRAPGFVSLLQIILEQQVSLASARSCMAKLAARLVIISPEALLMLSDSDLKIAGFSRQKTRYARHLAEAVISGDIDLAGLRDLDDDRVRAELKKLVGVGDWTADIYLLMAMLRPDVMPRGDLALIAAWERLAGLAERPTVDEFQRTAEAWVPYRSSAARLLWHFYLSQRAQPGSGA